MNEFLFAPPAKPKSEYMRHNSITPYSPEKSKVEATSADVRLRELESERLHLGAKGTLGRLATRAAKKERGLNEQIAEEHNRLTLLKERAAKALALAANVTAPMAKIAGSKEVEVKSEDEDDWTDGINDPRLVLREIANFNDKLHAQEDPGILKEMGSSHDERIRRGYCVLCGENISDRTDTLIGFQDPKDVSLEDDGKIRVSTAPHSAITSVILDDAERHGLRSHPLIAGSQEVADKLLSLESYLSPTFDGSPNVTQEDEWI
jgi:hypothetical protein